MDQQIGRLPSMEAFLPLSRMDACADSAKQAFEAGEPYKHVVIDDFFDPALVDEVLEEFPKPGDIKWQKFDNAQEIKLASSAESSFGPTTRLFLYHLNSATFLGFLSKVTGIPNLIADPCFSGGGLHQIPRGGKLGVHADFNKHPDFGLDRRLNLILYLNKEWRAGKKGDDGKWIQPPQAPHVDSEMAPGPYAYSCDFSVDHGSVLNPELQNRAEDYVRFALQWYKEAEYDMVATLTPKKKGKDT